MTQSELLKFILSKGYKSHDEVKEHFKEVDPEIIEVHLMGLIEKKLIGKASYKSENDHGHIYWAQI